MFQYIYTAQNGIEALDILHNNKVDVIITDINMPYMDGMSFIKEVRQKDKKTSIIVLTAHADNNLLFEATNLQIDGYIIKPINFSKISQALSNALSRMKVESSYTLKNGFLYNTITKTIKHNDTDIILGKKESLLLELLLENSHKITNKEEIIYHIWNIEDVTDSALKNLFLNLRAKIGKENIVNYPGHGWKVLVKENP